MQHDLECAYPFVELKQHNGQVVEEKSDFFSAFEENPAKNASNALLTERNPIIEECMPSKKPKPDTESTLLSDNCEFENSIDDTSVVREENTSCDAEKEHRLVSQKENTNSSKVEKAEDLRFNVDKRLIPSVVDRYYTKRYEVNLPKGFKEYNETKCSNFNDVCILRHSNKLCVLTLAPSHPVVKNKNSVSVTEVTYKVSDRLDHTLNQVSGKRKRGAHWLNQSTPVCIVTCSDGSKYTIHSGARGKLVEINEQLQANPSLLQKANMTKGYIAIVMPKVNEGSKVLDDLLSEEQYQDYLLHSDTGI